MSDGKNLLNGLIEAGNKGTLQNTFYGNTLTESYSNINATRYPTYFIGMDNEDIYGKQQGGLSKFTNAIGKGVSLAGTTFLQGTVGLVNGTIEAVRDGNFSSFYDNSFNKTLNDFNSHLEDVLPNYYTNQERNAAWYSPDTWATANFWSDTILKNMGFAAGAYLSGAAWTKAFSALSQATSKISAFGSRMTNPVQVGAITEDAALLARQGQNLVQGVPGTTTTAASDFSTLTSNNAWGSWAKNATHAVFSAAGESQIEAYHAKDQYRTRLIQEYENQTGKYPDQNVLDQIEETASQIGNATFGANMPVLMASNFIQFPLISKSARMEAGVLRNAERSALYNVADAEGNIIRRAWGRGERFSPRVNTAAGETLVEARAATAIGNQLDRFKVGSIINKVAPFARMIISPTEALEEGAQTLIPSIAENYFDKGSSTKGNMVASLKQTLSESLDNKEFWVSLMAGGLTGGIMENFNPLNRSNFARPFRERQQSLARSNAMVNEINSNPMSNYVAEIAQSVAREEILAAEATQAILDNNRLEFEDKATDSRLNYLIPRIQYQRGSLVNQDIANWRQAASTEEGWRNISENNNLPDGINREDFLSGLTKLQNTFNTTSKVFEALNQRYGNSVDEQGRPTHSIDVLMKMGYIASKIDDYNQRISTLSNEVGVNIAPLLEVFSRKQSETEPISVALPNGEIFTMEGTDVQPLLESFLQATEQYYDNNNSLTVEDKEDTLGKIADIIELTARRTLKVDEYQAIRDNPSLYDDTGVNSDVEATEEPTFEEEPLPSTGKEQFYQDNIDNPVILDFGNRGQQLGTLKYNTQDDILAVQRPDGSLYEVTNQDFRDGLVRFQDPSITIPDEFLNSTDPRTTIKRAETIQAIKSRVAEKMSQLRKSNDRVEGLKTRLQTVRDRINGTKPEATQELQELEQRRLNLQISVRNSATVRKADQRYLNGEISLDEYNTIEQTEYDRRGGNDLDQRIKYLQTNILSDTLESYEKAGTTIAELRSVHTDLLNEYNNAVAEQQDLQREYDIYQELLNNPFGDYNLVLNDIEKQLTDIASLEKALTKHQNNIQKLLNDVRRAIVSFAKMLRDKSALSQSPQSDLVNRATTAFIDGNNNDSLDPISEELEGVLSSVKTKLNLSEQQRKNLESTISTIQSELQNINNDIESRLNVYEDLVQNALLIENPLDPAFFSDQIEEVVETPSEEPTESAIQEAKGEFNGAKKLLRRLFSSTVVLPDSDSYPPWYNNYTKAIRTINSMSYDDRDNLAVKLITARNEKAAGLEGLIDYMYGSYFSNEEDKYNPTNGAIATVVIKTKPNGEEVYIDADGNEIGNVGTPTEISKVVGTKLPNSELFYNTNKEVNYVKPEQVSVSPEVLATSFRSLREEILADPETNRNYQFYISRGQLPADIKENKIVGNLIPNEQLSDRPLLRLVRTGEQFTTNDGEDIRLTKGSVVFLETEGSSTPLYVPRMNNSLVANLLKSLQSLSANIQNKAGFDTEIMSFVDSMLPYGMQFNKVNLTLRKGDTLIDLKDPNFVYELQPLLTNSKVRVDHPMMTPFTEYRVDGTKHKWPTFQEYLLSDDNRTPLIYTNIAKHDAKHKYLILRDFFNVSQPVVEQELPIETVDPVQNIVESSSIQDKEKLKAFIDKVSTDTQLLEDIMEANNQITKYDC